MNAKQLFLLKNKILLYISYSIDALRQHNIILFSILEQISIHFKRFRSVLKQCRDLNNAQMQRRGPVVGYW